ncbi:MAG TPA: hypothetical protein VKT21_07375 [Thermoplasmata archaeon]|nr:hypothetical protein [Thermoplasmata archaeon]
MSRSWRHSPAWMLVVVVGVMFAAGVAVPLEIAAYSAAHQTVYHDESLESSFRIAYQTQWSGFGHHWYNYTVGYAAVGLVWGDLWITVYFNGTTTEIPSNAAHAVVNNGTVGYFSFGTGSWSRWALASVLVGETLSVDTAEFGGDGNVLFIASISGSFYGSFSLIIP